MIIPEYRGKRVLSIGARKRVLKSLTAELNRQGFIAHWTNTYNDPDTVLREHHAENYDVIAFGHGTD
jgi:hypothetical protein